MHPFVWKTAAPGDTPTFATIICSPRDRRFLLSCGGQSLLLISPTHRKKATRSVISWSVTCWFGIFRGELANASSGDFTRYRIPSSPTRWTTFVRSGA